MYAQNMLEAKGMWWEKGMHAKALVNCLTNRNGNQQS